MRFHEPFDDVQWSAATDSHRQMRIHLRNIRRCFAPRSPSETRLLGDYRNKIQDFGRELLKPIDRIDSE